MKRLLIISIILFIQITICVSQNDNWMQIIGDGFDNVNNYEITEFEEFNGYLYAACGHPPSNNSGLWRSSDGNIGSWTEIINFSPAINGTSCITSFCKSSFDGGYFWAGTANPINGAMIYRSQDGVNWTCICKKGFGNNELIVLSPHMVIFKGTGDSVEYLYAGAGSHGGTANAQVWRTPYNNTDSLNWSLLVDFANIDTTVTLVSYFYLWNDKIYFATDGGGQLWESADGINFTKNIGVGNGFGVLSNHVIACIVDFQGYLYVTTTNKIIGGQLWRTPDGVIWENITNDAFGKADSVEELHNMRTSFDKIWITGYTNISVSKGSPIWKSDDGVNFVQSNTDGFGNINNNGENPVTIKFGNFQYFGGPNHIEGAQIWRTLIATGMNESAITNYSISLYPNPFSHIVNIQLPESNCQIKILGQD